MKRFPTPGIDLARPGRIAHSDCIKMFILRLIAYYQIPTGIDET
jgi:hypothetical protein